MNIKYPIKVAVHNKGNVITLEENTYKAAGGEGLVCCKGATAYKIYHDPKHMIPIKKIEELSVLSHLDNVLGPRDILLDYKTGTPIGFTMPFKDKTEYLSRLFNKNTRIDLKITPDMIIDLVKKKQLTIKDIHKNKILLVDINEMNFLIDQTFKIPYFIDVDSYQTASYKATALMESVRDRQAPPNQFSEGTDWFSFAIVTFQLYMGYHPYQIGKHPKFKPGQWSQKMDENISCFHKDVTIPDMLKDYSVIPKPHLDWYKKVFINKDRSAPPLPDGVLTIGPVQPILIAGTDKFDIREYRIFKEDIIGSYCFNGIFYTITEKGIYNGTTLIKSFNKKIKRISLASCDGSSDPVLVFKEGDSLIFEDIQGNKINEVSAEEAMQYGGYLYSTFNNRLYEHTFSFMGKKILHSVNDISMIFSQTAKVFSGVVVQDILGHCRMSIPYAPGSCADIEIVELNGKRIIDAKFDRKFCVVISEEKGKYKRSVICFEKTFDTYSIREEADILYEPVNFTCMSNGVCINIPCNDKIEVFADNNKIKAVDDPPFTTSMKLINDGVSVYFINKTKIYSVKLK